VLVNRNYHYQSSSNRLC